MGSAYLDNADLNAARAELRGVDENVPQALSGYRPTVRGDADAAIEADRVGRASGGAQSNGTIYPRGVSLTVDQPLFLGFRTKNSVKQAQNAVRAARAVLRNVEQQTLLAAVKAFMNVVLAQVVLNLRAENIVFLREQLRAANDRLAAREGTPTDVAQANGALQGGLAAYAAASAGVTSALATYQQVIGHRPETLGAADHVERYFPKTQQEAINRALANHPTIVAAQFNIDVASYNVKILDREFPPPRLRLEHVAVEPVVAKHEREQDAERPGADHGTWPWLRYERLYSAQCVQRDRHRLEHHGCRIVGHAVGERIACSAGRRTNCARSPGPIMPRYPPLAHSWTWPRRQFGHSPQRVIGSIVTRSPGPRFDTSDPTERTTAAPSCPTTWG